MADTLSTTTRRGVIGAFAAAPLALSLVGTAALAAPPDLDGELDWWIAHCRAVETPGYVLEDAADLAADRRFDAALRRIEALPSTPPNARIKARAILAIHGGDVDTVGSDDRSGVCTDIRLMRQVLAGLVRL